jgi:hypothetical protein
MRVPVDFSVGPDRSRQRHVEVVAARPRLTTADDPILASSSHLDVSAVRQF